MADPAHENASSNPGFDVEEFVASIRKAMHDFNNVLTSMMGWAELGQTLDLDERAASYMKDIFEAGKRGQELVHTVQQQLLEASRTRGTPDQSPDSISTSRPASIGGKPATDTR